MMPPIPSAMRATAGDLPIGDGWTYEVKWDGMRLLAASSGDEVRFLTSNRREARDRFPELHDLGACFGGRSVVVDGEVVAIDEGGAPSFSRLQPRMHAGSERHARAAAAETPVTYVVFDVLHFDGHDLTPLPWTTRRQVLDEVFQPNDHIIASQPIDDGQALLDVVDAQGLEGVIAKRQDASYAAGRRSPSWVKVKIRRRQEFVVGGWTAGDGERTNQIGALLVGYHEDGHFRFAGRVGSGLGSRDQASLLPRLIDTECADDPFDPPLSAELATRPRFCRATIVVEVAYGEWTSEGRLRHPSYVAERPDADPEHVQRDQR